MVLKECSACTIYRDSRGGDDLRIRARVTLTDNNITLHFEKEDDMELGPDTDTTGMNVDFYDNQVGYVKTLCNLMVEHNEDPWILEPWIAHCNIIEVVEIVQRQKDLRVRLEEEVDFVSLRHGHFKGIIQNISVGGILLSTNMPLSLNEQFEFEYCFLKKSQQVRAVTIREQQLGKGRYGYGCQFLSLTKGAERDIRQFVFKQQLKKIG